LAASFTQTIAQGVEHPHPTAPADTADFAGDCVRYSRYWESSAALLARLPEKRERSPEQARAAEQIKR
jgi:hypothetical protein